MEAEVDYDPLGVSNCRCGINGSVSRKLLFLCPPTVLRGDINALHLLQVGRDSH